MPDAISAALQAVRSRIDTAARAAGRAPESVSLLAVSKTFPADALRAARLAGQRAFGENYVQEFAAKASALADLDIEWHFIGPLQSNKTRIVAETAHWVHSVDRFKIGERLSVQRAATLPPLNICLQVNVSGESSKSGCHPDAAQSLAHELAALPNLRLRGLMCIPEASEDEVRLEGQYAHLVELFHTLRSQGLDFDTLSMGMSADLECAVRAGSTMVRVGSAIFGRRHYP